jgi:glutathione S-transferase
MPTTPGTTPDPTVLWQLRLSHYNEKVRWALDLKRIAHLRRSLLPGLHAIIARRLTGGEATTPVLTLDGRSIGDSTRIIAALEERWPNPPLYPQDPSRRRRALELEEFFDQELGPHIRRASYFELLPYPDTLLLLFTQGQPRPARALLRAAFPLLRARMRRKLEITADAARESRRKTIAAMDRLEDEIQPSGYLVGDSFTVADLTAAALLSPLVRPAQFSYRLPERWPEPVEAFRDSVKDHPGYAWVTEMYRRHRGSSAAVNE